MRCTDDEMRDFINGLALCEDVSYKAGYVISAKTIGSIVDNLIRLTGVYENIKKESLTSGNQSRTQITINNITITQ